MLHVDNLGDDVHSRYLAMSMIETKVNVQRDGISKKARRRDFKRKQSKQKDHQVEKIYGNEEKDDTKTKRAKVVERLKQSKQSTEQRFAQNRATFDEQLRKEPHVVLWEQYCEWAGERLTSIERREEQWTSEQVVCLPDDDAGGDSNIMEKVKAIIGADYNTRTGYEAVSRKRRTPSVACIMVALSTASVLSFAKRMYDGQQVGKLFSKHTQVKQQGLFIRKRCKNKILPTAAGNVSRLDTLFTEGFIDLQYTQALLLDFGRDSKLFNLTEHNYRDSFFKLIHNHVRKRIVSGMKLVVVVPSAEKMPTARSWGAKVERTSLDNEDVKDAESNDNDVVK